MIQRISRARSQPDPAAPLGSCSPQHVTRCKRCAKRSAPRASMPAHCLAMLLVNICCSPVMFVSLSPVMHSANQDHDPHCSNMILELLRDQHTLQFIISGQKAPSAAHAHRAPSDGPQLFSGAKRHRSRHGSPCANGDVVAREGGVAKASKSDLANAALLIAVPIRVRRRRRPPRPHREAPMCVYDRSRTCK